MSTNSFSLRTVLVPTDFSDTSEEALRYATELASLTRAEIHLMHVYQIPVYAMPDGAILARPEYLRETTDDLGRQLDETITRYAGQGVTMRRHLVMGMAYQEINRMAKELRADLVVMGTHGRSGLSHLLLGSVAERVVRTSEIPVLTVPRPKK